MSENGEAAAGNGSSPNEGSPSRAAVKRSALEEALRDLDYIAAAVGYDAPEMSPLKALSQLREREAAIFTSIPTQYLYRKRKENVDPVVPNPEKYGVMQSPARKKDPLQHPGQGICDPNKPLLTNWKKGQTKPVITYETTSQYSALFKAQGTETPTLDLYKAGNRRQELEEKRAERLTRFIPIKKSVAKSGNQEPKAPMKVSGVFVPSVASNTKYKSEGQSRRQAVDQVREEEVSKQKGKIFK